MPYAQVAEEKSTLGTVTDTTTYLYGIERIQMTRAGQGTYYHDDGLGSTRALTDQTGNLTDSYDYDDYGALQSQTGTTKNDFLFAGEQFDVEAGLYYNRARHLDVNTGRFTGLDPFAGKLTQPITLNKYAYANGDPVNQRDPSGKFGMGDAMAAVSVSMNLATLAYGGYQLYQGDYSAARWTFTESLFFGVLGYKKSVVWIQWWSKNRAIRQSYNAILYRMITTTKTMAAAGKTEKAIAEKLVALRNEAKIVERAKMESRDVAVLEARNMNKYGNPIGPTVEWLLANGKTYEEIIESATDSNIWYNLFFFTF
ncbi:MAG: hypothetical protein PHS51_06710 [Gallionella sp.]|nr:hypothetical protein [Gallionella sp.]